MIPPDMQFRTTCRVCTGPLEMVLSLGTLHLNAFPQTVAEIAKVPKVPHTLCVCRRCSLAQLAHTVPPDLMYREYFYRSSINEMMVRELKSIVYHARGLVALQAGDVVLDIGANDGTLLEQWRQTPGVLPTRVAVEPARNLHVHLASHCDLMVPDYFPAKDLVNLVGTVKVITAIAMAYDLEDPINFFTAMRALLHPEGVIIVQFQDMGQMLQTCAFDNIVPEHLEYYTLGSLQKIAAYAGLVIDYCLTTPINGGSLRVVLRHPGNRREPSPTVTTQLAEEEALGLGVATIVAGQLEAYTEFDRSVRAVQRQIRATVDATVAQGAPLDAYGASTKANVTFQVLGLGPGEIRRVIDRSPAKNGRFTITGIPIRGEEQYKADPAPAMLVPIWQFKPSVLERNQWYLEQGGQLIFPLPRVEIVGKGYGPQ